MNTVLILSLLSVVIMSCMTQQQILYAFKVWNVNLHRTVDLPAQTIINRTTITDTGKCSYDAKAGTGYSPLENLKAFGLAVQKENTKDKQMSVSDLTTMFSIYDKDKNKHFKWCGME